MSTIKQKDKKLEKHLKKYVTPRYILIAFFLLVLSFAFSNLMVGIILMILFVPLGVITTRTSRFIPHVNIETITATAILLSYWYGPIIPSIYAVVVGVYALVKANFVRWLLVVAHLLTVVTLMILLMFKGLSFPMYFTLGIIIKNAIAFVVYLVIDPDQVQNVVHRISHTIWNITVVSLFMQIIFGIVDKAIG